MRQRSWILGIMLFVGIALAAGSAQAATIVFSDVIPLGTTDWDHNLSITKFDPTLGTLISISFLLEGDVQGDVKFESFDASPTTVSTNLQAKITLKRPDNSVLVVTTPVESHVDNVSEYDNLFDWGGTSGKTYSGLSASASNSASTSAAADLALFTGLGSILLPITAEGTSSASGAGNLITQFETQAGAKATVTYTYGDTTVPEPSSLALLLLGGGIVALGARRKLRK